MLSFNRSLTATTNFVWEKDPALLSTKEGFEKAWLEHSKTGSLEPLQPYVREGAVPTVFKLAPLSRKQWLHVGSITGLLSDYETVAFSLRDVQGMELNGAPVMLTAADVVEVADMKRVKAEFLDSIYDPFMFRALAVRALEHSKLDPTRGQA